MTLLIATLLLADLTRFWTGHYVEDVTPRLHGPVLVLAGGGGDQTEAMQAAVNTIRGCRDCDATIDIVVIRASGGSGYNPYLMALDGVNSVISMVITDRESAARPDVVNIVRMAEMVFFAGGDQCNYIRWIKDTPVAEAVKEVYRRGGAVGGTSAGLAIQGEIAYDACPNQSARSAEVLLDPFHEDVSLSRDFFPWPAMRNVITDTHFQQRDRMGRLLVFLARTLAEEKEERLLGLGVGERTVLLLNGAGRGYVYGEGPVQIIAAEKSAEVLQRGTPLTYRDFRIWHFDRGDFVDLRDLPDAPDKTIDVVEGKLSGDPY